MDKTFAALGFVAIAFGLILSGYPATVNGRSFVMSGPAIGAVLIFNGIGFLILAFDLPKKIRIKDKWAFTVSVAFLVLGLMVAFYRESTLPGIIGVENTYFVGFAIILVGVMFLILALHPLHMNKRETVL